MKKCSKCKQVKSSKEFNKNRSKADGLHGWCKSCRKQGRIKYYQKNKKRLNRMSIDYYYQNKDYLLKKGKEYYSNNKEKIKKRGTAYYRKNKEKILEQKKDYYKNNRESINIYRTKRKQNSLIKLRENVSSLMSKVLTRGKGGKSIFDILDYSFEDLKKHLEEQFYGNLNWESYGSLWSLDHIIPQSLYIFVSVEDVEFKKCWSLKNLRPLKKGQNSSKKNLLDKELIKRYNIFDILPQEMMYGVQ